MKIQFSVLLKALAHPKKVDMNFSKVKIKFGLSLHYNADDNYLFVNGTKIYKLKASNKNNIFLSQFCLRSISNEFYCNDLNEVSFKGNV